MSAPAICTRCPRGAVRAAAPRGRGLPPVPTVGRCAMLPPRLSNVRPRRAAHTGPPLCAPMRAGAARSAPAATSPSSPPPPPSPTRGLPAPSSRPASSVPCAPSPTTWWSAPRPPSSARRRTSLVTWVPGHRDHQLERGFNQAERLARGFARRAGLPYAPLLRRTRHGARQSGLHRAARAANVKGAFALREEYSGVLRKLKRVLIVDDVYTTGETLDHCAKVLAHAGLEPHVFTFARTVRATPSQASLDHAVQKERCP